jgi:NADH-quinone oxidoreductase subunit N
MQTDWLGIIPVMVLSGGGLIIFCVGAFWPRRPAGLLFALALLAVAATLAGTALIEPMAPAFVGLLGLGTYARYFTFLLAAITGLTLLLVRQYAGARGFAGDEFYGLLLFAALGMILAAGAVHWLIFFLGLELLSLSLYVLIAVRKDEPRSGEAGLKYFIVGAVATAFLTFGIAMLYAVTGTLAMAGSLAANLDARDLPLFILALSLILVGIGFKISLVPFHLWTPDVYEGAPAPVTAFLSTGSKVALFAALLRFCSLVTPPVWTYVMPALWVLAVLTMVVGNLTAIYQLRLKRLLAYSSVAQMGYLFMTLLAVQQGAMPALLFYLAVYAVMDLGSFGIVGALSSPGEDRDALEDYQGLGFSQPWRAGILAVCLISLAGLPPTAGFMGKFVLFRAVLNANFLVLAVVGMLTVILSIYYYMKVVVALYMKPTGAGGAAIPGADPYIGLALGVVLLLLLWWGIFPPPLFELIGKVGL